MNKAELIQRLADVLGPAVPKTVIGQIVETTFILITEQMKAGGEVSIVRFGTFAARWRKGRVCVDLRDPNRRIDTRAVRIAKFKPGAHLKKVLKEGTVPPDNF